MKNIYRLVSWNFRRIYKWLFVLWGMLLLADGFLLIQNSQGHSPFSGNSEEILSLFVFVLILLFSIAITGIPMISAYWGRSRSIYTIMGLPIRRESVLISNTISGMLAGLSTFAMQFCIILALYVPKGLLKQAAYSRLVFEKLESPDSFFSTNGTAFIKNGLLIDFLSEEVIQTILPRGIVMLLCEILILFTASLLFHCILTHKGFAFVLSIIICIIGAIGCSILFLLSNELNQALFSFVIAIVLLAICAMSFVWAAMSLRKSRNL